MNNNKIANVTYIPPCWCHGSKGYDIERSCFVDPPVKPVYVRINGRYREAKRLLWFWRMVENIQREVDYARDNFSRKTS